MGPSPPSKQSKIQLSLDHPRLSSAKIISDGNSRTIETTMGLDEKAYENWLKKIDSMKFTPQFLLVPLKKHFSTKGLCGSSGTLTLTYQDFPYLLTDEMYNRKGRKTFFTEEELWYLLYALLMGKKQITGYSPKVGDIKPQNIFLNQNGQVKIANVLSWPNQLTNYQKIMDNEICYLAPEEMKGLQTGAVINDDHYEQELYTIGLTVLSTGLLTDASDLYNFKKNQFNYALAFERINQWKHSYYSQVLRGVISNLCEVEQSRRMSVSQVTNWLSHYSEPIRKRVSFVINDAPGKVHEAVQAIMSVAKMEAGNIVTTNSIYAPVGSYMIHGAPVGPGLGNQLVYEENSPKQQKNEDKKEQ